MGVCEVCKTAECGTLKSYCIQLGAYSSGEADRQTLEASGKGELVKIVTNLPKTKPGEDMFRKPFFFLFCLNL